MICRLVPRPRRVGFAPTDLAPLPAMPAPSPSPSYPAQVIIYGPGGPTTVEGSAVTNPDGSVDIDLPIAAPPPSGTLIQIILYSPAGPNLIEGTTGAIEPDGSSLVVSG